VVRRIVDRPGGGYLARLAWPFAAILRSTERRRRRDRVEHCGGRVRSRHDRVRRTGSVEPLRRHRLRRLDGARRRERAATDHRGGAGTRGPVSPDTRISAGARLRCCLGRARPGQSRNSTGAKRSDSHCTLFVAVPGVLVSAEQTAETRRARPEAHRGRRRPPRCRVRCRGAGTRVRCHDRGSAKSCRSTRCRCVRRRA
jgi:hypothetical protein